MGELHQYTRNGPVSSYAEPELQRAPAHNTGSGECETYLRSRAAG